MREPHTWKFNPSNFFWEFEDDYSILAYGSSISDVKEYTFSLSCPPGTVLWWTMNQLIKFNIVRLWHSVPGEQATGPYAQPGRSSKDPPCLCSPPQFIFHAERVGKILI